MNNKTQKNRINTLIASSKANLYYINKPRQVRRLIDIDTPCPSVIIFANNLTKLCKPEV